MKIWTVASGAWLALALVACGSPESECREGVAQMKSRMNGIVGSGEHKEASDLLVQASTQADMAQTAMSAGNYKGCVEDLDEARVLLNRSQRNNQEK